MRWLQVWMLVAALCGWTTEGRADPIDVEIRSIFGSFPRGHVTLDVPGFAPGEPFGPDDVAGLVSLNLDTGPSDFFRLLDPLLTSVGGTIGFDFAGTLVARTTGSSAAPSLVTLIFDNSFGGDQYFTVLGTSAGTSTLVGDANPKLDEANFLHWAAVVSGGDSTVLSHPSLDGTGQELLFLTPNWNPGAAPVGIYVEDAPYVDLSAGEWNVRVANVKGPTPDLPLNSSYNALVVHHETRLSNRAFAHTVGPAGLTTTLDHPRLNGDPNAALLLTALGRSAQPGAVPVYDAPSERWTLQLEGGRSFAGGERYNVYVGPATPFVASSGANFDYVDDPRLNGNPRALLHAQRTSFPAAGWEPIGVWYDPVLGQWSVFNQDTSVPIAGDSFDLFLFESPSAGFEAGESFNNHGLLAYEIDRAVLVTHTATVGEVGNVVTEPLYLAPVGGLRVRFNVLDATAGGFLGFDTRFHFWAQPQDLGSFGHAAAPGNVVANATTIRHPLTDGNPNALVFASQMDIHFPIVHPPVPGAIGVQYFAPSWEIFREDFNPMSAGPRFSYYIAGPGDDAFQHVTAVATITGDRTQLDHPSLNDHPTARLIVNHVSTPIGVASQLNDHPIGTIYDPATGRWSIRNRDGAAMAADLGFNVLVLPVVCGDTDTDGRLQDADAWRLRNVLVGTGSLSSAGQARCSVIGTAADCDIADWVVIRRSRLGEALPGTAQVCTAAL